mmetsp:Transcript_10690/g.33968  ORF Transcript_10690/g.33968 Transcript_10690/m.33968 type:complete len:258 (+) Transcript_10690:34-807(+)
MRTRVPRSILRRIRGEKVKAIPIAAPIRAQPAAISWTRFGIATAGAGLVLASFRQRAAYCAAAETSSFTKSHAGALFKGEGDPREATSLADFRARDIDGKLVDLAAYAAPGRVVLVVNVACKCGLTDSNMRELAQLHDEHGGRGFAVLAFPSNSFHQEPGDAAQIAATVRQQFGAHFPLFDKVDVNGADAHPLFKWLNARAPGMLGVERVQWNFTKWLLVDGQVVQRYAPTTSPTKVFEDVEKHLQQAEQTKKEEAE